MVNSSDAVELLDDVPLTSTEAGYVEAARAVNTLRGYRSDWRDFTAWCGHHGIRDPLPAAPATITGYLSDLAQAGAKVGTLSRRLSAIRFVHELQNRPDPTRNARVMAVWEGIRRTHGAPPDRSAPLMPPELLDVLDACPTTKIWRTPGRAAEPDLAGARDRAMLLVGFVAALRRSELAALTVDQVAEHPNGLVVSLPRSKTNQTGEEAELVVLPRAGNPARCPVTMLERWLELAGVIDGPLFRPVGKSNRALDRRLHPDSINTLVQHAVARAGLDPPRTARTASAPASSPTPTSAAPPTEPSLTRPGTAPSPPSAPTSGYSRPGPTTPQPRWGCSSRRPAGGRTLPSRTRPSPGTIVNGEGALGGCTDWSR